ncbi:MAG: TetR/AcrR family transcriptional regulator, partial [Rhodobacterales bacterium]|nr:TetR/AcrR family transcriptional regulator [Rhodobacterales bacterium]
KTKLVTMRSGGGLVETVPLSPEPGLEPRKVQIMAVTEQLIAEHGYEALRLRDVAKSAGVSIGMIQHYFETREALLLETLGAASWRRAAEFVALEQGIEDPVRRVRALLGGSIADRGRCQVWMETCASATRHEELVSMIERIYGAWRTALRAALNDGVEAGAFNPQIPLDEVVNNIMVTIDGVMVAVALQLRDFDAPHIVQVIEQNAGRLLAYDFARPEPDPVR